jgi:hypothetical protein
VLGIEPGPPEKLILILVSLSDALPQLLLFSWAVIIINLDEKGTKAF